MNTTSDYLTRLLQHYELPCAQEQDWVLPYARLPAMRAIWHPAKSGGRLDVQVMVDKQVMVDECFAGLGEGEAALQSAFTNFTLNSFHPILGALWGKTDDEYVSVKSWIINGKSYRAYIGNLGLRASEGLAAQVPPELMARIETAIRSEELDQDVHWFRLFFCNVEKDHTFEALKDNGEWAAGQRALKGANWMPAAGYYSVRWFIMLRADESAEPMVASSE